MSYIRVYEHRSLRTDREEDGFKLTKAQLRILQEYHGEKGTPYFTLINNGVKFCAYVGVLQVGNLTIEVLPKTDASNDKGTWQQFLIAMLRATSMLNVEQTGFASLKIKSNSILDLYFLIFLQEVRYLQQTGLVKKYKTIESNNYSLKGSLVFGKHITQNLVHAERFYTRSTNYSNDNIFNKILVKTVKLIARIGKPSVTAAAKSILLDFPECGSMAVSEATFSSLVFNRKTDAYRNAISIARLLLLNYHPDVRQGHNNVIALMFDMNLLWERYIYKKLSKVLNVRYAHQYIICEQLPSNFWKPDVGAAKTIKPDIVIYKGTQNGPAHIVLDTKWKQPLNGKPDDNDLKQMLTYNLYKSSFKSLLVYPGNHNRRAVNGNFQMEGHGSCSLVFLSLQISEGSIQLDFSELLSFILN